MTRARQELISLESTPCDYCVSRCVCQASQCGEDQYSKQNFEHRRQWILDRLKPLADVLAIQIAAFAIMSNHYHMIVQIDRDQALRWSDEDVVERWGKLFASDVIVNRWWSGKPMRSLGRCNGLLPLTIALRGNPTYELEGR